MALRSILKLPQKSKLFFSIENFYIIFFNFSTNEFLPYSNFFLLQNVRFPTNFSEFRQPRKIGISLYKRKVEKLNKIDNELKIKEINLHQLMSYSYVLLKKENKYNTNKNEQHVAWHNVYERFIELLEERKRFYHHSNIKNEEIYNENNIKDADKYLTHIHVEQIVKKHEHDKNNIFIKKSLFLDVENILNIVKHFSRIKFFLQYKHVINENVALKDQFENSKNSSESNGLNTETFSKRFKNNSPDSKNHFFSSCSSISYSPCNSSKAFSTTLSLSSISAFSQLSSSVSTNVTNFTNSSLVLSKDQYTQVNFFSNLFCPSQFAKNDQFNKINDLTEKENKDTAYLLSSNSSSSLPSLSNRCMTIEKLEQDVKYTANKINSLILNLSFFISFMTIVQVARLAMYCSVLLHFGNFRKHEKYSDFLDKTYGHPFNFIDFLKSKFAQTLSELILLNKIKFFDLIKDQILLKKWQLTGRSLAYICNAYSYSSVASLDLINELSEVLLEKSHGKILEGLVPDFIQNVTFCITKCKYKNLKLYEQLAAVISLKCEGFSPAITFNILFGYAQNGLGYLVADALSQQIKKYSGSFLSDCSLREVFLAIKGCFLSNIFDEMVFHILIFALHDKKNQLINSKKIWETMYTKLVKHYYSDFIFKEKSLKKGSLTNLKDSFPQSIKSQISSSYSSTSFPNELDFFTYFLFCNKNFQILHEKLKNLPSNILDENRKELFETIYKYWLNDNKHDLL